MKTKVFFRLFLPLIVGLLLSTSNAFANNSSSSVIPADNSFNVSVTTDFEWDHSPDKNNRYYLQVASDSQFGTDVVLFEKLDKHQTDYSFDSDDFLEGSSLEDEEQFKFATTYYWRIYYTRDHVQYQVEPLQGSYSFTTIPGPNVTITPGAGYINENDPNGVITLTATADAVFDQGDIQVNFGFSGDADLGVDFTSNGIIIPQGQTTATGTINIIDDLINEVNETVNVYVASIYNGIESGNFSQTITIIDNDIDVQPNDGAVDIAVDPDFQWNFVTPNATDYKLQVSSSSNFSNFVINEVLPANVRDWNFNPNSVIGGQLNFNTKYYWRIYYFNNNSNQGVEEPNNAPHYYSFTTRKPNVTLSMGNTPMPETGGSAVVTAILEGVSGQDVTVNLGYSNSIAVNNVDFSVSPASILVPAGSTSASTTVSTINDFLVEGTENVVIDIASVIGGIELNGSQQASSSILDDDFHLNSPGSLTGESGISLLPTFTWDAVQNSTFYTLSISQNANMSNPLHTISNITSNPGYQLTSANILSNEEIYYWQVSAHFSNGSVSTSEIFVFTTSDQPIISLTVPQSVDENGGSVTIIANSNIQLSGHSVYVSLAFGGSATYLTDYEVSSSTITIPDGANTGSVTLTAVNDYFLESGGESVDVSISNVVNGTVGSPFQGSVLIVDDEFNLTSPGSPSGLTDVAILPLFNWEAVGNSDEYELKIAFDSGMSNLHADISGITSNIDYQLLNSDMLDYNSVYYWQVIAKNSGSQIASSVIYRFETEAAPVITLSANQAVNENAGSVNVVATSDMIPQGYDVTVDLAFSGDAVEGNTGDYSVSGTSIVIPSGSSSGFVTITSNNDYDVETDESIIVDINNVTNGLVGSPSQSIVTILDDDFHLTSPGSLSGGGGVLILPEFQWSTVVSASDYTLSISTNSDMSNPITEITGITNNTNYRLPSNQILQNNQTYYWQVFAVNGSAVVETSEIFSFTTSAQPVIELLAPASLPENGGSVALTAQSDITPQGYDVTVGLAFSGTATLGVDYNSVSTLTISDGTNTGSVALIGLDDFDVEPNETIVAEIVSVTNGTIGTTNQVSTTISDDDFHLTAPGSLTTPGEVSILPQFSWDAVNGAISYTLYVSESSNMSSHSRTASGINTNTGYQLLAADILANSTTYFWQVYADLGGGDSATSEIFTFSTSASPQIQLAALPTVEENGGSITITANSDEVPVGFDVTVELAFSGTASQSENDYSISSSFITIHDGTASGSITLTANNDFVVENGETIIAEIVNVTNGTAAPNNQTTITIVDDDFDLVSPGSLTGGTGVLILPDFTWTEVSAASSYTLYISQNSDMSNPQAVVNGITTYSNYTLPVANILVNNTTYFWQVFANDGSGVIETSNIFKFSTSGVPTITLNVPTAFNENGGTTTVQANSNILPSGYDVTVELGFSGSAQLGGVDYSVSSNQITISNGTQSGFVTLTGVDDYLVEGDETIVVEVLSVTNGTENGTQQVSTSIIDNDFSLLSPGSITGTSNVDILPVFTWSSLNNITDYTLVISEDPNFSSEYLKVENISTNSYSLDVSHIFLNEHTYYWQVFANYLGGQTGTSEIFTFTTSASPVISLSVPSVFSENNGSVDVTATSDLTPYGYDIVVDLAYAGTADGSDYTSGGNTITIPSGSSTGSVSLTSINDYIVEADETVVVSITGVTNGTEDGAQEVTATLEDDDFDLLSPGSPTGTWNNGILPTFSWANVNADSYQLMISQNADMSNPDEVINGINVNTNYQLPAANILLSNKTYYWQVYAVNNSGVFKTSEIFKFITSASAKISVSLNGTVEEDGGTVSLVALSDVVPVGYDITVNISFSGQATENTDYTVSSSSITIPSGSSSAALTIQALNDYEVEAGNETIVADVASVVNGTENGWQHVTTTILDDDFALVSPGSLTGGTGVLILPKFSWIPRFGTGNYTLYISQSADMSNPQVVNSNISTYTNYQLPASNILENNNTYFWQVFEKSGVNVVATSEIFKFSTSAVPVITLDVPNSFSEKNGTTVVKAISNILPNGYNVEVELGFSGSAVLDVDYKTNSNTITIPDGSSFGTITLTGKNDFDVEGTETIVLEVLNVTNGTENGTQVVNTTLSDDDFHLTSPGSLTGTSNVDILPVFNWAAVTGASKYTLKISQNSDMTFPDESVYNITVNSNFQLPLNKILLNDKTYYWQVIANNGTSNFATSEIFKFSTSQSPVVSLSVPAEFSENDETVQVTATTDIVPVGYDVVVSLSYGGTASNTDYNASGSTITIPSGSNSASVSLTSIHDFDVEDDETIEINIVSVTNGTDNGTTSISTKILNNDFDLFAPGSATGTWNNGILPEFSWDDVNANSYTLMISQNSDMSSPDEVISGLTGTSYVLTSANILLNNKTYFWQVYAVNNITTFATSEIFKFITSASGKLSLSINGTVEENGGTVSLVALSDVVPVGYDITVDVALSGTATINDDYSVSATTITIPDGSSSAALTIQAINDFDVEVGGETIVADITNVTNGTENGYQHVTTTIVDDDFDLLSPGSLTGGTGVLILPDFSWTSVSGATYTLYISSNADMSNPEAVIPGITTNTAYRLPLSNILENNKTYFWQVYANSGSTVLKTSEIFKFSTSAIPVITLDVPNSFNEKNGTSLVKANSSLIPDGYDVKVELGFSGTAQYDVDYKVNSNIITIPDGSNFGTIQLKGKNDFDVEGNETVIVEIISIVNGTENGTQIVNTTVTDDDFHLTSPGSLTGGTGVYILPDFSWPSLTNADHYKLVVSENADMSSPHASVNGITQNTNYSLPAQYVLENNKTYYWQVFAHNGTSFFATSEIFSFTTSGAPVVSLNSISQLAENGGTVNVTATSSMAPNGFDITVGLDFSGTASNSDYTVSSTNLIIPSGSTTGSITLTGVNDFDVESSESIIVDIVSVTNGTENGNQQETTSMIDDDFNLTSPGSLTGGADVFILPEFSWESVAGASNYTLVISQNNNMSNPLANIAGITQNLNYKLPGANILVNDNIYYWQVFAENGLGTIATSEIFKFTTSSSPVISLSIEPVLIENGGTITLTALSDIIPDGYDVIVELDYSGTALQGVDFDAPNSIIVHDGQNSGTVTITGLNDFIVESGENIVVNVTNVINGNENGNQIVTASMSDDDFDLTSPGSLTGTSGNDILPEFTWTPVAGVSSYVLTISQNADMSNPISFFGALTNESYQLQASDILTNNQTYYWQVFANNSSGTFATSEIFQFSTGASPKIHLTVPSTMDENGGAVSVVAVSDIVPIGYDVIVELEFAGSATNNVDYTVSSNFITIHDGTSSGTMAVNSVNDYEVEPGNETVKVKILSVTNGTEQGNQKVTTTIVDDDFDLVSPGSLTGGTGVLILPDFNWTVVSGVTSYTLKISQNQDMSNPQSVISGITQNSNYRLPLNHILKNNKTYYWQVLAVNGSGAFKTSEIFKFSTSAVPVVTLYQANSFNENGGSTVVKANSDIIPSGYDVTVELGFSGTAQGNGVDYIASSTFITIPDGSDFGEITLNGVNDYLVEGDESVVVEILSVTNGTENGTQSMNINIFDDEFHLNSPGSLTGTQDVLILPKFSWDAVSGATSYILMISEDANFATTHTVISNITQNVNYPLPLTSILTNDKTYYWQVIAVNQIGSIATSEVFKFSTTTSPVITLSAPSTISENGGSILVTANSDIVPNGYDVTVNLAFSGTALQSNNDYSVSNSVITIPSGSTTGSVTISAINDFDVEADETIVVDVASVLNGTENGTQQVTTTLVNDDFNLLAPGSLTGTLGELLLPKFSWDAFSGAINYTLSISTNANMSSPQSTIPGITTNSNYSLPVAHILMNDAVYYWQVKAYDGSGMIGTSEIFKFSTSTSPTISLSALTPIAENGGAVTLVATSDIVPDGYDITVNLAFSGTALQTTNDYEVSSSSITIADGTSSGSISIRALNDYTVDPAETIIVDVASVTNGTENGVQQVSTSIIDDDFNLLSPGSLAGLTGVLILPDFSWNAVTGSNSYTLFISQNSDMSLPQATITGITNNTNYRLPLEHILINNKTYYWQVFALNGANVVGTSEIFKFSTSSVPVITLDVPANFSENGGSSVITANSNMLPDGYDVTVELAFTGSATLGADYTVPTTTLKILDGQQSGSITLTAVNDFDLEGNESIIIDIASVTNGTENNTQQVTTSLIDDEFALTAPGSLTGTSGIVILPEFSWAAVPGATSYNMVISENSDLSNPHADLTGISGSPMILPVANILFNNRTYYWQVYAVSGGNVISTSQVFKFITGVAPKISLAASPTSISEDGGMVTVTAHSDIVPQGYDVMAKLDISGSALLNADYVISDSVITITSGTQSGTMTINTLNDFVVESGGESIILNIDDVTNGTIGSPNQQTITVTDDDFHLSAPGSLTGVANIPILPKFSWDSITGATNYTLVISEHSDLSNPHASIAGLTNASNYKLPVIHILNNDRTYFWQVTAYNGVNSVATSEIFTFSTTSSPIVSIEVPYSFNEDGDTAKVIATSDIIPDGYDVKVKLAFSGTATLGSDYSVSSNIITIADGTQMGSASLIGLNDFLVDGGETVVVDIVNVTNGTESGTQQVTTIINDNDFHLTSPGSLTGGTGVQILPRFTWEPANNVTSYKLMISTNSNMSNPIVELQGITSYSNWQLPVEYILDNNSDYYWQVFGMNGASVSATSEVFGFTTTSSPVISLAFNSATVNENGGQVELIATSDIIPDGYDVKVNLNYSGIASYGNDYTAVDNITIHSGNIDASILVEAINDFHVEPLGETIAVNIASVVNGTKANHTPVTTVIVDDDFNLTGPGNVFGSSGVSILPQFSWTEVTSFGSGIPGSPEVDDMLVSRVNKSKKVNLISKVNLKKNVNQLSSNSKFDSPTSGVSSYTLFISLNADMSSPVAVIPDILTNQNYQLEVENILANNTTYYWQVFAHGTSGELSTSEIFKFTTLNKTAAVLIAPSDLAVDVAVQPKFVWANSTSSNQVLKVATDANFTNVVFASNYNANSTYDFIGTLDYLTNNTIYYWGVFGVNSSDPQLAQVETYSGTGQFKTVSKVGIMLSSPFNNDLIYANVPTLFSWYTQNVSSTLKFNLQVSEGTNANWANPTFSVVTSEKYHSLSLYEGHNYNWRVIAFRDVDGSGSINAGDVVIEYSPEYFLTTAGGANVNAIPSWPIDGGEVFTNTPTLYWYVDTYGNNLSFDIEVSKDINGPADYSVENITSLYHRIASILEPGTLYYWRVKVWYNRGVNGEAEGRWSDWYDAQFFTHGAGTIAQPQISYPVGGVVVYSTAPVLYWSMAPGANGLRYNVYLDEGQTGSPILLNAAGPITNLYYQLGGLTPGTTYDWYVVAVNNRGESLQSAIGTFRVVGGISGGYPVAAEPLNMETVLTNMPTLSWNLEGSHEGIDYFTVSWSTTNEDDWGAYIYANPSYAYHTVDNTVFSHTITSQLSYGEDYYWAVAAHYEDGYTQWSEGSFRVTGGSLPTPVLDSPVGGLVVNYSTTLYWHLDAASTGIVSYSVYYSLDYSLGYSLDNWQVTTTYNASTYVDITALIPGASYRWYVVGNYSYGGTTNPSAQGYFTINPGFSPVQPMVGGPNNVTVNTSEPVISWVLPTVSESKLTYELEVSTNEDMSNAMIFENIEDPYQAVSSLSKGTKYYWRSRSKNEDGNLSNYSAVASFNTADNLTDVEDEIIPTEFSVSQNYPNPFNPSTVIEFAMPKSEMVTVKIYDVLGREVTTLLNEYLDEGIHNVTWNALDRNGRQLSAGAYIYRVKAGDNVITKKMMLLK